VLEMSFKMPTVKHTTRETESTKYLWHDSVLLRNITIEPYLVKHRRLCKQDLMNGGRLREAIQM
jgi:hypothetical protein